MRASDPSSIFLSKGPFPLTFRVAFLLVGLLFLSVGLFALGKVVLASLELLYGRTVEGSFALGVVMALAFTVLGALSIWTFFVPGEALVFDAKNRSLTFTRSYPFGRKRVEVVDLGDLKPPQVVWKDDADRTENGYWALRISMPSGRVFDHEPSAHSSAGQKRAVETLRDNIAGLM